MDKIIKLAGIPIEIHTMYNSVAKLEEYETDESPAFSVSTCEADIEEEQKKSIAEAIYEGIACHRYSPPELENTAIYRKIAQKLPQYNAVVFHGSAVAVGEKAFLFTAKSGTGKTTHTRLWLKNIDGSYVVNGDKPILRVIGGKPYVCGTPWMGKEGLGCNKNVALEAICFVNRAEQNRIEKTELSELVPRLIGQTYRPPDGNALLKTIKVIESVGKHTNLYELYCNMDDEAAFVSYKGMNG